MKRRFLLVLMAAVFCGLAVPADVKAGDSVDDAYASDDADDDSYENGIGSNVNGYLGDKNPGIDVDVEWDDEDEIREASALAVDDLTVVPAKMTIRKGQAFTIQVVAVGGGEFDDLSEEEWYELYEENIDSIIFRSSKSSVVSVSKTGKVRGKKRGSALIRTTVNLSDGESKTFKTKVYVKK